MKCLNCGAEGQGDNFCTNCGNKLNVSNISNEINQQQVNSVGVQPNVSPAGVQPQASQNYVPNTPEKKSNKVLVIVIVIISVIGLLCLLVFGGLYFVRQALLNKVDKELQEEIGNIGSLDDITIPDDTDTNDIVKSYYTGERVNLVDGSSWYVMYSNGSTVTLLSTQNYKEQTYFSRNGNYYEKSIVKDIVENQFLPELRTSISNSGGNITNLTARIVSVDDIRNILNIPSTTKNTDIEISSNYKWLFETGSYWTSTHSEDESFNSVYIVESWVSFAYVSEDVAGTGLNSGNKFYIRPVIETSINNIK